LNNILILKEIRM